MLKTSNTKLAKPRKDVVGVGVDSRAECDGREIVDDELDNNIDDEVDDKVGKKGQNLSKSKN